MVILDAGLMRLYQSRETLVALLSGIQEHTFPRCDRWVALEYGKHDPPLIQMGKGEPWNVSPGRRGLMMDVPREKRGG